MMTFPSRASNQKNASDGEQISARTLSGLLATLNSARASPMEIATRLTINL
jgi:hypothetical protein